MTKQPMQETIVRCFEIVLRNWIPAVVIVVVLAASIAGVLVTAQHNPALWKAFFSKDCMEINAVGNNITNTGRDVFHCSE